MVAKPVTCDEFAANWTRLYPRPAETTNRHNAQQVRKFGEDFAGRLLSEVSREEAREWALENEHRVPAVRAMFADALADRLVDENPFAAIKVRRGRGRRDILVLSEEELGLLVEVAGEVHGDYGPVFAAMIEVAAWTGMRPGELYALRHSWVDFERREIHVKRQFRSKVGKEAPPKSGEDRRIALLPPAAAALRRVPRHLDDDLVFHTKRGQRFSGRVHHYYWDPVRKAFWSRLPEKRRREIDPGFDFYELRHFCATYLLETLRLPAHVVAHQLGHRDNGKLVLATYGHPPEGDEEESRHAILDAFEQIRGDGDA